MVQIDEVARAWFDDLGPEYGLAGNKLGSNTPGDAQANLGVGAGKLGLCVGVLSPPG